MEVTVIEILKIMLNITIVFVASGIWFILKGFKNDIQELKDEFRRHKNDVQTNYLSKTECEILRANSQCQSAMLSELMRVSSLMETPEQRQARYAVLTQSIKKS